MDAAGTLSLTRGAVPHDAIDSCGDTRFGLYAQSTTLCIRVSQSVRTRSITASRAGWCIAWPGSASPVRIAVNDRPPLQVHSRPRTLAP